MTTQIFLNRIRALIGKGDLKVALRQLQQLLKDSPKLDDALMHAARFEDVIKHIHLGTIDTNAASITQNQIRMGILNLLREIEEQGKSPVIQAEMEKAVLLSEEIYEYKSIKEKIYLNRGAGTSELLKDKQADDLDDKELKRFFKMERVVRAFDEEGLVLDNLTIQKRLIHLSLAENGHIFKGTFLCLGKRNQIQTICHTATESKFIIFKGTDRAHILLLETLNGNIIRQFEKMMMLLRTHIPLGRDREKSQDIYEIPLIALREFVANAFVHRDFQHDVKSYIQVELYDDRIEIKSPGHLPDNIDVNKIEGTVLTNPTIAAVFHLYKHMERAGTGINVSQQALQEQGLKRAQIENIDNPKMVKVTIYRSLYNGKIKNVYGNDKTEIYYNNNNLKIPRALTKPPFISEIFIGREQDLIAIKHKFFSNPTQMLLINGLAGVGKTALAAKYYDIYRDSYVHTAWVTVENNIIDALLTNLASPLGLKFDKTMSKTEQTDILLRGMAQLEQPCLLVIDNVNDIKDLKFNYQNLMSCRNLHILITTRISEFSQIDNYHLESLSELEALTLFKKYYPKLKQDEEPILKQIFRAVGSNTLVLELLAKNLFLFNRLKQHYTLNDLLVDLQTKGLLALSKTQKVQVYYPNQNVLHEDKPENIMASMYDLSELSQSEMAVLSVFTGLPPESIAFETFETLLPDATDLEQNLLALAQKGWIEYNEVSSTFKCSPIVQEIIKKTTL